MNVYEANKIIIPEGSVKRILDLNNVVMWEKTSVDPYTPFYIENLSNEENTVSIIKTGELGVEIQKSYDGVNWTSMGTTDETAITATIPKNGKIYLRSYNIYYDYDKHYSISASSRHLVGGNILSLTLGSRFNGDRILPTSSSYSYAAWYDNLFKDDINLIYADDLLLPIKLSNREGFGSMVYMGGLFQGCTSLITPPELPTDIFASCYKDMFRGCTSLTVAPMLPATTLDHSCYYGMFSGCTSLTVAPKLPATTLHIACYMDMFRGCTSLTVAPELPATVIREQCYYGMFSGCRNLTQVKCNAIDTSVFQCTGGWLWGVEASGIFYKNINASWVTGNDGIPEGWTVRNL